MNQWPKYSGKDFQMDFFRYAVFNSMNQISLTFTPRGAIDKRTHIVSGNEFGYRKLEPSLEHE